MNRPIEAPPFVELRPAVAQVGHFGPAMPDGIIFFGIHLNAPSRTIFLRCRPLMFFPVLILLFDKCIMTATATQIMDMKEIYRRIELESDEA